MRYLLFLAVLIFSFHQSQAQKATKEIITRTMNAKWEKPQSSSGPKVTITIHDIRLGSSAKATYAQELEGIPKGAMVTTAKIDFTQNSFYSDQTQTTRRIMTAWVYRDEFGEWTLMNKGTTYPGK